MDKKTIGIVGCGAIGTALAGYAASELNARVNKILLWDQDAGRAALLAEKIGNALVAEGVEDLVERADLVIEAASPAVVPEIFKAALARRKDIMVMSIGGVLGNERLLDSAREKEIKVMLPSGAISGIDALKASAVAGIKSVTITTRKGPGSIKGAPYLSEKKIDVDAIKEETVVFEGNALEAIKGFPKNINVSALLSLAGIGPEKTKVRIVVSPDYTRNTHEIEIVSGAGKVFTRTENLPSPSNPKTSYLAALAAITSLRDYFDTVRIGT
jgi:aspartate dehydrogenase